MIELLQPVVSSTALTPTNVVAGTWVNAAPVMEKLKAVGGKSRLKLPAASAVILVPGTMTMARQIPYHPLGWKMSTLPFGV